jgi:hypothetical protein
LLGGIVHAGRSLCPGSRLLQLETHLMHAGEIRGLNLRQ